MFKVFLLFIVAIVVYIGAINYLFSDNKLKESHSNHIVINKQSNLNIIEKDKPISQTITPKEAKHSTDNELEKEIESLFKKADNLVLQEEYLKAINIYDSIIEKLEGQTDKEFLKKFAKAHFFKAYIYRNYLESDDDAIKDYNAIVRKLKDSDDVSLLKLYYNAQTLKAYLLEKDEAIVVYNEIIQKFKNSTNVELIKKFISAEYSKIYLSEPNEIVDIYDEIIDTIKDNTNKDILKELANIKFSKAKAITDYFDNRADAIDIYDEIISQFENYDDNEFRQIVADALFAKSYVLMTDDGEESMEILDELIDRYKNSKDDRLSKNIEYSIINNIELALITNHDDTNYRELADKYLPKDDTKAELDMLAILRDAQESNQDEALQRWKEEHKDYRFENWSFEELRRWNRDMEEGETKDRIKSYLDEFIRHDSNYYYQENNSSK